MLRFVGRKSRWAQMLWNTRPSGVLEYREAFCGSAMMLSRIPPTIKRWINDIDSDIVRFHSTAQSDGQSLIDRLIDEESKYHRVSLFDSARLFNLAKTEWRFYECPVAFYILKRFAIGCMVSRARRNTASFSFKQWAAFRPRKPEYFTRWDYRGVRITQGDYSELLFADGDGVFVYLDPTYLVDHHSSPLYPSELTTAQHFELFDRLKQTKHKFLMTIGDDPVSREMYENSDFIVSRITNQFNSVTNKPIHQFELVVRNY